MRKNDLISGIEGVSSNATSGSTATVNLPINRRHFSHRLFVSGTKDNGSGVQVPAKATDVLGTIRYLAGIKRCSLLSSTGSRPVTVSKRTRSQR